jgi:hypothetical protein
MFQYAMARTLAHRNKCQLVIDKSLCVESETLNSADVSLRPFGLDVFNVQAQIVDGRCPGKTLKVRKECRLRRAAALMFCKAANRFTDSWRIGIFERKDVSFDKSLLRLPENVVLQGYFPSHRYFQGIEQLLRQDFTFIIEPDEQNRKVMDSICSSNSVSLHVRHGDYISSEKTRNKFGICSIAYYQRSVGYIAEVIKDPLFFVFTNDPDFVKDNLKMDYPSVFVTHNSGKKSYEDMRLMSLCRHNIIANSSFSWWGAWLNKNPEKIVVAPSPAFDAMGLKDYDFYPNSWMLLPKS